MRNISCLKKQLFQKCNFSERVNIVQKYLVQKSSSSVDISILNNSSTKKVGVSKCNCSEELPILNPKRLGGGQFDAVLMVFPKMYLPKRE